MESVNIKIVVVGATGVGKSTLIHRFVGKGYKQKRNENLREITVANKTVKLSILEYNEEPQLLMVPRLRVEPRIGEEPRLVVERRSMDEVLLRFNAVIFVYDITNEQSFLDICAGIQNIRGVIPHNKILIGNKSDLEDKRKVNISDVKTFAQEKNVTHIQCNARKGINVELAFYKLVEGVLKDRDKDLAREFLYFTSFQLALKDGRAKNDRIPIMIVGQDRSGKTSLMKHLLGLPFNSNEPSTVGINVEIVELTAENAEEPWKTQNNQFMNSKSEVEKQVVKQAAEIVKQDPLHLRPEPSIFSRLAGLFMPWGNEPQFQDHDAGLSYSRPTGDKMWSFIKTTKKNIPPTRVSVHDLAGQSIFYETHQCFLKLECPYVLTHDLTKPLDDPAHPRFKSKLTGKQTNLPNSMLVSNLDYLLMWLTALDNLGGRAKKKFPKFVLPPVLIALTNSDHFHGDLDEIKTRIKEAAREKASGHVFVEPFVIDNTSSERSGTDIRKLRKRLYELCQIILDSQDDFPLNWLNFEAALSKMSEREKCISLQQAKEVAKVCNVKAIDEALKFFHRRGVLVHHTGSDSVVLNPPWLMKLFTDVITIPEDENAITSPYIKYLQTKGILMEDFFHGHPYGELLMEMMTRFSLMCEWAHTGKAVFFVPAVAPIMAEGEGIEEKLSSSPVAPVFVEFHNNHLPIGVYVRVQVALINKFRRSLVVQEPQLFSNYTLVPVKSRRGEHNVYLIKLCEKIKVGVVPRNVSEEDLGFFLRHLRESLMSCFDEIKSAEYHLYCEIEPKLVFKCSACSGEREKCYRHDHVGCKHDECGHFWSLDELQQQPEDRACQYGSKLELSRFSLERVKPWLCTETLSTTTGACGGDRLDVGSSSFAEIKEQELRPPLSLQNEELPRIAQRIPRIWKEVALLTKKFEPHDIENISSSRVDEDQTSKALTMLFRFKERQGGRKMLASALKDFNINLSEQVLSGHFIDNDG